MTDDDDFDLGELTVLVGKGSNRTEYTLGVDRLAATKDGACYVLGVVGPSGAIKGLRAALTPGVTAEFKVAGVHADDGAGNGGTVKRIGRVEVAGGYAAKAVPIGHGRHHALFRARVPGLLAPDGDAALAAALRRGAYTTPFLPGWAATLARALREGGLLSPLYAFRCRSALLTATPDDLDAVVSREVREGRCRLARDGEGD